MWIVGGYGLTEDQVWRWCRSIGHDVPPDWIYIDIVERYIKEHAIPIRVVPCDTIHGPVYLILTDSRTDANATPTDFEPFQEETSKRAPAIKAKLLEMGFDSMWIVGGYGLTEDQVWRWCRSIGHDVPPDWIYIDIVERYIEEHAIPIRVVPCDTIHGPVYLILTDSRTDANATPTDFEPFQEETSKRAPAIKAKLLEMGFDSVHYVSVADPYRVWQEY
ncbi:uncharacterized protein FIBRA_03892 [Fibroporia radiculosa]|uniref:Uncharacterized protein n=1 Tax=Fibroporia radiculosa TaxID=599839 RepID=J4H2N3_9APHY|nr:uncharacterized protein FIBRA_03892 [Fibroporia radiculosa]CCM01824.1 predicted protein [Fibroporia radiculosa]